MKRSHIAVLSFLLSFAFVGCGGSTGETIENTQTFHYPAPTELAGKSETRSVSLTWEAVEGAEFYAIFYGRDDDLDGTEGDEPSGELLVPEPFATVESLTGNVVYHFAVAAGGSLGKFIESEKSSIITVKASHAVSVPIPDPIK